MPKTRRRGIGRGRQGGTKKNIDDTSESGESIATEEFSTSSNASDSKYSQPNIVLTFLQMLNTVKLRHWRTTSHPEHKATDELYSQLNDSIDKFVEIMLGKGGVSGNEISRVDLTSTKSIPLHDYSEFSDFKQEIEIYKKYLIGLTTNSEFEKDSDLLNVRDEMLGQLNQFTYLLTFK